MLKIFNGFKSLLLSDVRLCNQQAGALIHTTAAMDGQYNKRNYGPKKFLMHNKKIFEPRAPEDPRPPRPAVSSISCFLGTCFMLSLSVRLPLQREHQIFPEEDVVRRQVHPRHERRRGAEAAQLCAEERSYEREGGAS